MFKTGFDKGILTVHPLTKLSHDDNPFHTPFHSPPGPSDDILDDDMHSPPDESSDLPEHPSSPPNHHFLEPTGIPVAPDTVIVPNTIIPPRFTSALSHFGSRFTVRFTFFSPLSLRRGVAVVCFEMTIGDLLCLIGWRHVISGILARDPWFRTVLLLLH